MSTSLWRLLPPALLAALLAACDVAPSSPTAPAVPAVPATPTAGVFSPTALAVGAVREVQENIYDLTDSFVQFPCGDGYTEVVKLQGQIYERFTLLWHAKGGLHAQLNTMPVGLRGVGMETGAEYRIAERETGVFNATQMAENSTYTLKLNVHAPALGLRARLVIGGRYVVNANGELVVEREVLRAECSA